VELLRAWILSMGLMQWRQLTPSQPQSCRTEQLGSALHCDLAHSKLPYALSQSLTQTTLLTRGPSTYSFTTVAVAVVLDTVVDTTVVLETVVDVVSVSVVALVARSGVKTLLRRPATANPSFIVRLVLKPMAGDLVQSVLWTARNDCSAG